jgi:hypothetical protein
LSPGTALLVVGGNTDAPNDVLGITALGAAALSLRHLLLIGAKPNREGLGVHEDCRGYERNSTHLDHLKKKTPHFT